jgi:membrane-associated protein
MYRLLALGIDPEKLIDRFGKYAVIGIFLVIFAESGLLVGFFLPGDSLLFTAGLLVATEKLDANIFVVLVGCFLAAVIGDQVGYQIGRKAGPRIFDKPDSRLFKKAHVEKATEFFEKHGAKAIVLARFVPIVRTFTPVIAGVSSMKYRTFAIFNVVGGLLWAVGVTSLGYGLGKKYPWMGKKIEVLSIVIIAVSVLPMVIEFINHRRKATAGSKH